MDQMQALLERIAEEKDIFTKAKLMRQLAKENGVKIKDIASYLKMKSSYVCHILRLNRLPEMLIDGYYTDLISKSHLFIISRLKDREAMVSAYEKVLSENLTVLQTEMLIREWLHTIKTEGVYLSDGQIKQYIESIKARTGARISFMQSRIKGKMIIEYKGSLKETSQKLLQALKRLDSSNPAQADSR